ncbi:glycoside hydrolase family 3 C-terminal domain-containing protein [Polaribacter haliotis]|uniref:beta-glucosidase n=1 Tax=Polaribacter haliotis TaxID=1888915 RepID=A0A7L8AC71_9FLAO|nr:glycoside hydrolase family 3 C-terminal domain-containing protein [Polaribacter haliotis]QOD59606.1 glycoside hydrolase family 3 C-terminal domain-containing protein [Polaribacter haliotis]
MIKTSLTLIFSLLLLGNFNAQELYAPKSNIYKKDYIDFNKNGKKDIFEDTTQDIEKRVDDLLSQMNINEKTNQMVTLYGYQRVLKDALPTEDWKTQIWKDGMGSIDEHLNGFRGWGRAPQDNENVWPASKHAWALNEVQRWFIEETRMGIPVDFTNEGIRGVEAFKATNFPTQLGIGHTWNKNLVREIGNITGKEARILGYTNVYAPILDVGRDQRWGRYEEIYGESPFLVAELGIEMCKGLQTDMQVAATGKHFAAYSNNKGAREGFSRTDPQMSPREVERIHIYPWKRVIKEANLMGIMSSYNDYDGVPIQGSKYWLTDKLRGELGFKGYIVSDSDAVIYMYNKHKTAKTYKDAIKMAVNAGLNMRCTFRSPDSFVLPLRELISEGEVTIETINKLVKDILRVKFLTGLFDAPYVKDMKKADELVYSKEHRKIALQASRESIVLLKNENNLLPLKKGSIKKIAVSGPNANDASYALTHYGPVAVDVTTVLQGIKNKVGSEAEVLYTKGCDIIDKNWPESEIIDFDLTKQEQEEINKAVEQAKQADIAVVVVGGNGKTCGENKSRTSLNLPGHQLKLIKAVYATGTPTVIVQISGRPLSINWTNKNVPAILAAWYPGSEGGTAVADVLFGDYNPGGKLTVTVPKTVGQIPMNFPYKPASQIPAGSAGVNNPLYSFGYGLSYTTFKYSGLKIFPLVQKPGENITVSFNVTNTGKVAGDEVVQLYTQDKVSSVTTYVQNLRGFDRVHLKPGETKNVSYTIKPEDLEFLDAKMKWVVEPGEFKIEIGSSSEDIRLTGTFAIADKGNFDEVRKKLKSENRLENYVHTSSSRDNIKNLFDNNTNTYWSTDKKSPSIDIELEDNSSPQEIEIAFYKGDERKYKFEVQLSCGGGQFITAFKGESSGKTKKLEAFKLKQCTSSDIRIIFSGNTANEWSAVTELRVKEMKK